MSEKKIRVINELLNEEKWTRATLNSYTINNFKELDSLIEETVDEETESEIKQLCDEHLQHTKNSIIALYISGIISLRRRLIDDTHLIMLIQIFSDNHKWNIVEYLCERILQFGENKYALRTLAECYENENEDEKKYDIWERLIKVDYEEADIVRLLGEKKEEEGNIEAAVDYYKKAIYRYVNKKLFSNVKEIWMKLLEYTPEDTDFFFHVEGKIQKTISSERAAQLLEELYAHFKENELWDKAIGILKRILDYDSKNTWARTEIIECYRGKYKDHSHLDEYLKLSNLGQSWRNVHDAIADFEKHIAFDASNFVCHRSWGIGLIRNIESDEITIDFARKRGHSMSLKMAVNALNTLSEDHIWVLKVIKSKEELKKSVKEDPSWALRTVIKSFDNAADMKKIKAELVPNILSQGEWSSWSTQARKILKNDPNFGNLPDKRDVFTVRENPITLEEKMFNSFKAEKGFFQRLQVIQDFISDENASMDSEYFAEMFDYFSTMLKSYSNVNEIIISSYLFIEDLIKKYPHLDPGLDVTFEDLLEEVENVEEVFPKIEDSDIKKKFLQKLKDQRDDWPELYVKLFPHYLTRYIIDEILESGKNDLVRDMFRNIVDNYRDYREPFIWLARSINEKTWNEKYGVEYEKILIGMIHLLDISFREISNRRDVSLNRKLNKQIQTFLFKDGRLKEFLTRTSQDSISRIFSLINDIKVLDPSIKLELRNEIVAKFPDFKFYGETGPEVASRGLLVTIKSYELKQKELQNILEVEVPQNSKEIGAAIELGDLRENAEYKSAKEKQEMLNNAAAKLKEDLERAHVFNPENINTGAVGFGTKVELTDNSDGEKDEFTILGPWESEPSKNIISYMSPLGTELMNHKVGDTLKFKINDRVYDYTVENITAVDI